MKPKLRLQEFVLELKMINDNIHVRTYSHEKIIDIEDKTTKRILGRFKFNFMGDEMIFISMLMGDTVLKYLNHDIAMELKQEFPDIKYVQFVMETALFHKFKVITDIKFNIIRFTKVQGKNAVLVEGEV